MAGKIGRRTLCTPEVTERVVQALRAGNYIETSCDFAGISVGTYYGWCARARAELESVENGERRKVRKKEEPFVKFLEAVKKARSTAEVESVARIRKAGGDGAWQADAWFLERSFPDRWGRRNLNVDLTSGGEKIEGPVIYLPGREDDE